MKALRYQQPTPKRGRKKRLNVKPGESVNPNQNPLAQNQPSASRKPSRGQPKPKNVNSRQPKKQNRGRKNKKQADKTMDISSDDSLDDVPLDVLRNLLT